MTDQLALVLDYICIDNTLQVSHTLLPDAVTAKYHQNLTWKIFILMFTKQYIFLSFLVNFITLGLRI